MLKIVAQKIMWASVFASLTGSLFAVDGVVLIDQNHALAGSVTTGDAPGFPVTISQSGSYRLTSNLTVADANTTAIQITANNVTLDLNGFSILGPVVCTSSPAVCPAAGQGIGIEADAPPGQSGPRGIKVFNGTVRGMGGSGIFITGEGSAVDKMTIDSNAGSGAVVAGAVTNSAITLNGGFGVLAVIVRGCNAIDNHNEGIILDASGGVGEGNIASFNGSHGILAPNGTVTGNTMVRNVRFGVSTTCPSVITSNTIVSNTLGSIQQTNLEACAVSNNATRP